MLMLFDFSQIQFMQTHNSLETIEIMTYCLNNETMTHRHNETMTQRHNDTTLI